jgi:gas vesicle protein
MFTFQNYKKEQDMKIIKASIIGGVVGAVISLFISPIRGAQARKLVANKAKNAALNFENKFHEGINHVEDSAAQIKSNVDNTVEDAKNNAENSINSARSKVAEKIDPSPRTR